MLALYGALDTRVTSSEDAAKAALEKAGLVNELVVESDADHAFFNDTGPRYNAAAAYDAWRRVLDWFTRYRRVAILTSLASRRGTVVPLDTPWIEGGF